MAVGTPEEMPLVISAEDLESLEETLDIMGNERLLSRTPTGPGSLRAQTAFAGHARLPLD